MIEARSYTRKITKMHAGRRACYKSQFANDKRVPTSVKLSECMPVGAHAVKIDLRMVEARSYTRRMIQSVPVGEHTL